MESTVPAVSSSSLHREYPVGTQLTEAVVAFDDAVVDAVLGEWHKDVEKYVRAFEKNRVDRSPFAHVVLEHFFSASFAAELSRATPPASASLWQRYNNPLEVKHSCNTLSALPQVLTKALALLNSSRVISFAERITGIKGLRFDPLLHGGGVHGHSRGGRLSVHLDYAKHPLLTNTERRLNLVVYITPGWKKGYGGDLELWNENLTKCVKKVSPRFNRAVLFETSGIAYHGIPKVIRCPQELQRVSLAVFYVADARENVAQRLKATFVAIPDEPDADFLQRLRTIRAQRRITPEDLGDWKLEDDLPIEVTPLEGREDEEDESIDDE